MSTQTEPTVKDLIPFGYAPGKYMGGTCRDCSAKLEWVDKLAPRCKECATRRWREKQETKEEVSTQTEQRPLVERLREGCIINPKRWSGDPGEPSPVNESATEELLMEAADEIERLRAIEAQAIEQSEYVQRELLSPSEAEGLKREVERLRAELDRARWIPVTERLPKAYVPVLGFRPPDDFLIVYLGDDDSSFQDNFDFNTVVGVTHWMPLSPPPAQQSQEDN